MAVGIERTDQKPEEFKLLLGKTALIATKAGIIELTQTEDGFEVVRQGSGIAPMKYKNGEWLAVTNSDGSVTKYKALSNEDLIAHDMLEPMV